MPPVTHAIAQVRASAAAIPDFQGDAPRATRYRVQGARRARSHRLFDALLVGVILAGIWAIATFAVQGRLAGLDALDASSHWSRTAMWYGGLAWLVMCGVLMTIRTLLWASYRPRPSATHSDAPSLTIIIPAYNEGALVAQTIGSCVAANYPLDRLQIIAVDDGSRDDTWTHIERAAARFPTLVTTIRFPENRGKRAALAAGFAQAGGEVIVTIDSDSVIDRDTLLAMVGPFADPKVGAVAGKVLVLNREAGILPRMMHVRFILAFDFLRSVQSTFGMVYCCPGALAAYRTDAVRRILPGWLGQKFMGVDCTIGEDRALTNDILALGYDAVYQSTAVVRTMVPTAYRQLCKMLLRWDRSHIREEGRLLRVVLARRPAQRAMALFDMLVSNLRYPVAYGTLAMIVILAINHPTSILPVLAGIGLGGTLYTLYYLRTERSWRFVYGVAYAYFAFFALTWIFPYALATVRNKDWLTR